LPSAGMFAVQAITCSNGTLVDAFTFIYSHLQ